MAGFKEAYTAQELAPLLGYKNGRNALDRAKREGWQSRPRSGRGGGFEWLVASMPDATRTALILAAAEALPDPATCTALAPVAQCTPVFPPAIAAQSKPFAQFSTQEREVALARKAFVLAILDLEIGSTRAAAIGKLLKAAESGTLPAHLADQIEQANARYGRGKGRGLSRRTLYHWCAAYEEKGEIGLVPGNPQRDMAPPPWLVIFLTLWQRPSKPSMAHVYEEFLQMVAWVGKGRPECGLRLPPLPEVAKAVNLPQVPLLLPMAQNAELLPSIYTIGRWIAKMGTLDREQGRMTGNELLRLKPYQQRTTEHMLPDDWYTADGTTLDAEIINPEEGKAMKGELVLIVDVKTRKVVGASFGKAENALIVLDALRIACCAFGVPAAFYSDNGPGYKNNTLGNAIADGGRGILARVGITPKRAIPGRPRGKGMMERAVKTVSDRISKSLPSCTHADMDKDAAHNIYKLSRKEIKATGTSTFLPQWRATLELIGREIDAYNRRPHTKLPKFTDAKGKVRHYSPNEYWEKFVNEGFVPELVPNELRDTLFRPSVIRTVLNSQVKFARHTYFSRELEQFHSDKVEIRYDVWDCTQISVWTLEGRKICDVELNGNAVPYVEQAELGQQRANRRAALDEAAQAAGLPDRARAALPEGPADSGDIIDVAVVDSLTGGRTPVYVPCQTQGKDVATGHFHYYTPPEADDVEVKHAGRPIFASTSDKYIELMQHPDTWTDEENQWVLRYVVSDEYFDLYDYYETRELEWREPCVSNL